ncbi:MAG: GTPase Era [Chitinispirillaceae bacterium]
MNDPDTPFRSALVALVGRPNSGKSTLMNSVLEEQISIVTSLPQTTRQNLKGVYTSKDMQLVFVDTPGIHKGKYTLNEAMLQEAVSVLSEGGIDLVCYLVDLSRDFGEEESTVARIVSQAAVPVLVIFNKSDLCRNAQSKMEQFFCNFPELSDTAHISMSALSAEARDCFLEAVAPFIPEGPHYFDPDSLTDASMRFLAAEFIRKQIILNTKEEVPHAAFVEIEFYKELPRGHEIDATIHVETQGQKGIIIGNRGVMITRIRKAAQKEIQQLVGERVKLSCHVKVSPGWRDNPRFLRFMGIRP